MVVGGPNRRSDYHVNNSEEFFYQLRGDMVLKTVVDDQFVDVPIKEASGGRVSVCVCVCLCVPVSLHAQGNIFLLPANVPHSPQRGPETVGLVIERRRTAELLDRLRWYCDAPACRALLYEEHLQLRTLQIGQALTPVIGRFYSDAALRTCRQCGHVSQVPDARQ